MRKEDIFLFTVENRLFQISCKRTLFLFLSVTAAMSKVKVLVKVVIETRKMVV